VNNAIRLKLARKLAATRGMKVAIQDKNKVLQQKDTLTISKVTEQIPAPLSNAQERMWFLHQLEPDSSAYNVCVLWHLQGELDSKALQQSSLELIQRHSIFRTKYFSDHTLGAKQQILEHFPPEWREVDLHLLHKDERKVRLQQIAQDASTSAFDLGNNSTLRLVLAKMERDKHVLIMVGQHIVWDGPSFGIFSNELAIHYNAIKANLAAVCPPLPIQYIDFAHWHRKKWHADSQQRQEQLNFWQQTLTPLPESIDFPCDYPRSVQETEQGSWFALSLPQNSTTKLMTLASEEQVTVFEVVVSVIALLMTRLARASEVTIGTVASHRNLPELEHLIGNFGNVVPLRLCIDNQQNFRQLLRSTAKRCRDAFSHADLPFELLLDQLKIPRGETRNPLLDTMVTFLNHGMSAPAMDGLDVSWSKHFNGTTQTDLSFDALLQDGTLQFQATWRTSLYKPKTVPNHLQRLIQLLESCIHSADTALANFSMLLPAEKDLQQWGERLAVPAQAPTLVDWFEQTVADTPNQPALTLVEHPHPAKTNKHVQNLTFAQLNQQANVLAHWLIQQGVGPEDRVAVVLPRQLEWFIIILATLKSGAAFVAVDPNYPDTYTKRVLKLATPKVIITDNSSDTGIQTNYLFGSTTATQVLTLSDIQQKNLASQSTKHNPTNTQRCRPLHKLCPACITFTSGSTGEPKGVVVPHAALVNLLSSHKQDLYTQAQNQTGKQQLKVGHAWSLAFDAAWQPSLWMFAGHQLYLFSAEIMQDPVALATHILLQKMDFIELTPGMLDEVLPWLQSGLQQAGGESIPAHIPAILGFGGESVKRDLWQRISQLENSFGYNLYGPTEATVDAMIAKADSASKANIGGPVAGAQVYVLDTCMQLAPFGMPGELAISGNGLARGYLSRSDLTAAKFIANPYGEPGSRLYLTGDRVRWLAEGKLEYIGRIDEQVKIRGFRVEPLEVEATIQQLMQTSCAVIARPLGSLGMQLICFIELHALTDSDETQQNEIISAFRGQCEQALPAHLLPKHFILIQALPRLPNGKINRRALPTPEGITGASKRLPSTPLEQQLSALICEVLGLENIGIDEGFFEVGGDSISVVKLVSRARRDGLHLTPKQIFNARCVAKLAQALNTDKANQPSLEHDTDESGMVHSTPLMQKYLNTGVPLNRFAQIASVSLPEDISLEQFQLLLVAIVRRHPMLTAQLLGSSSPQLQVPSEPIQDKYCSDCYVQDEQGNYHLSTLHQDPKAAADMPTLSAAQLAKQLCAQLEPGKGRMLAAYFIKACNSSRQSAWLAINHLVVDAASWHIICEDLANARNLQLNGQALTLPPVPTSWKSWSAGFKHTPSRVLVNGQHTATLANAHTTHWYLRPVGQQCPVALIAQRYGLPIAHLLPALSCLAAITSGIVTQVQSNNIQLVLERHGREPLQANQDLSRTIGWFAREVTVPITTALLDNTSNLTTKQTLPLLRQWCAQIIQHDVELSGVPEAQTEQTPTTAQLGFNFLGDLSKANSTELWSVTPLISQLQQACSDNWPILHTLDLSVYYALNQGEKRLCFNAITSAEHLAMDKLQLFFRALEDLIHDLSTDFRQEVQHRLASNTALHSDMQVFATTPLQSEMLRHCQDEHDPWSTQIELTLCNQQQTGISEQSLKTAAYALVSQHEALRAGFLAETGGTFITEKLAPVWKHIDLRNTDATHQGQLLQQHRQDWYSYKFELDKPPLLRFLCVQTHEDQWHVLIHCHHLLLDGWSVPRILQQWLNNLQGANLSQPPLNWAQYLDWLQKQDPTTSLKFWDQSLKQLKEPSLLCPQRKKRIPSNEQKKALAPDLHQAINQVAVQRGISPAILFQLAWAHTLATILNQREVAFGLFDSGRSIGPQATESLVGLVTRLVPICVDTQAQQEITEQLQQLQNRQLDWQMLPPVRLDNLKAWHNFGEFFDSLLVIENALDGDTEMANPALTLPGVTAIEWQDSVGQAVALFIYPGTSSTNIRLSFDPVAVSPQLKTRLLAGFEQQLQQLLALCQASTHTKVQAAETSSSSTALMEQDYE